MFTRDFVYLGVSALQVVLTALVTPILTRRVGVGQYGQLTLAIVVAQLLGVTFNLGLPFAAQKVFAEQNFNIVPTPSVDQAKPISRGRRSLVRICLSRGPAWG